MGIEMSRRGALVAVALAGLTAAAPAAAQRDLVIAIPANQEPASLDGQIDPYQSTWLFNSFLTDPLVVMAPDGSYQPGLATDWTSSPDGKVWTFTLRPGVTFQDGAPFDAAAVKANLERVADPKLGSAQMKNDIGPFSRVEAVDPLTVRITYDTPWVTLLDALRRAPLWSPASFANATRAEFEARLVGTGPFVFGGRVPNDRIVFRRWGGYGGWNPIKRTPGPVALDSVTIRFIAERAVHGQVLASGDAHVAFALPPQFIEEYRGKSNWQFYAKDQAGTGLSQVMNVRKPPLNDVRVRRALLHGRDPAAINELLYDGAYAPSDGPLNNVHPCFWPGSSTMYPYDPAKAQALLDEAGWKAGGPDGIRRAQGVAGVTDGAPLRLRWSTLHHKEIAEAVQAQYKRIGVDLQVAIVPGPVQLDMVRRQDFELMYERQRSPDPLILDQVWNSKWDQPGGWAWTGYKSAELDETLNQLRALPTREARCEAAKKAQEHIMTQALMMPTLSDPVFVALSTRVKDFEAGAEGNWFFLHNTTLN